ncbi:MAG: RNA polymerase factor sigma-54, partial [Candidatus Latescibacterota bacterium]
MIQSLKLLPLTIMQLEQRISEEIEMNPMLQVDETEEQTREDSAAPGDEYARNSTPTENDEGHNGDFTEAEWLKYMEDGFEGDYRGYEEADYGVEEHEPIHTYSHTMAEHLTEQLGMMVQNEREREIGEFIIGCINDEGYLELTDEEIAAELDAAVEEVERMVEVVRLFDPPGVGARTLREALLIQLRERGEKDSIAWQVLDSYFPELTNRRLRDIIQALHITEDELRQALEIIGALSPRPGAAFSSGQNNTVIPDIMVEKVDGEYVVMLM